MTIDGTLFKAEVYTASDAAKFLGISTSTLFKWEKTGKIKNSFIFWVGNKSIRAYMKDYLEEVLNSLKKKDTNE